MKYAELDNVLYRAADDDFYGAKLVGGRWIQNHESAKVRRDGYPMTEGQARKWAGKDWPKNQTATAA